MDLNENSGPSQILPQHESTPPIGSNLPGIKKSPTLGFFYLMYEKIANVMKVKAILLKKGMPNSKSGASKMRAFSRFLARISRFLTRGAPQLNYDGGQLGVKLMIMIKPSF